MKQFHFMHINILTKGLHQKPRDFEEIMDIVYSLTRALMFDESSCTCGSHSKLDSFSTLKNDKNNISANNNNNNAKNKKI